METLNTHLEALREAIEEHRAASRRMESYLAGQIEMLWADSAERRDELHTTATALGNRIEAATRTPFNDAA